jgi:hypothetical protein
MSNKKTLYIVGAGASKEAGLPTGYELKEKIASLLNIIFEDGYTQTGGDRLICEAIRIHVKQSEIQKNNINPYLHAAWSIRDAMPQAISIDNFIDTHNDDKKIELCGKLAIVRSILDAEKNSKLYINPSNIYNHLNFRDIEDTWYANFMKLLTENCTKDNLAKRLESIALIVFNYDRCIEHFIYNSLQNYYGFEPNEAGNLVNGMKIYHPYGVVGSLPWQGGQSVAFGIEIRPLKLLDLANQIKTFSEGTDPQSSEILAIRKNITNTNRVVFLGFAYHKLNMKLLMPNGPLLQSSNARFCFGTAKGISNSDCEIIKCEINSNYKHSMNACEIRNELDCCHLFEEYWRSLSLN